MIKCSKLSRLPWPIFTFHSRCMFCFLQLPAPMHASRFRFFSCIVYSLFQPFSTPMRVPMPYFYFTVLELVFFSQLSTPMHVSKPRLFHALCIVCSNLFSCPSTSPSPAYHALFILFFSTVSYVHARFQAPFLLIRCVLSFSTISHVYARFVLSMRCA